MRSRDMATLYHSPRDEKVLAVLDADHLVDPDLCLVGPGVAAYDRVVPWNLDEVGDLAARHLLLDSVARVKLPAIHEDVEPGLRLDCLCHGSWPPWPLATITAI